MDSLLLLVTSVANTLTIFCGFSIHSPVIICCGRLKNAFDIIHINPFLHDSFCVCVLLYSWRMYYSFIIFIHLNFQQNKSLILLLKKNSLVCQIPGKTTVRTKLELRISTRVQVVLPPGTFDVNHSSCIIREIQ